MSPIILDWNKGSDEENEKVQVENGGKEEKNKKMPYYRHSIYSAKT
jgi:hypothetical protein